MPTENVSVIDPGGGGDYLTIAAWGAATDNDLVSADVIEIGELVTGTHTITTQVQLIGATTDATRYRVLRAQSGARYDPITDTGAKVVMEGDGHVLLLSEQGSRVCDIGLFLGGNTQTTGRQCLRFTEDTVNSHGAACYVERVFCGVDGAADQDHTGIRAFANAANLDAPIILRDCMVVGNGTASNNFSRGFDTTSEGDNGVTLDNCVAYGCKAYGIYLPVNSDANTARNCVSANNATGDYQIASSGTNMTLVSLASGDATAEGTGALTSIVAADEFNDPANNDFRLKPTGQLWGAGTDLSADFTTDIKGDTWGPWSMGAYTGTGLEVYKGGSWVNYDPTVVPPLGEVTFYRWTDQQGETNSPAIPTDGARRVLAYLGAVASGSTSAATLKLNPVIDEAAAPTLETPTSPVADGKRIIAGNVGTGGGTANEAAAHLDPPQAVSVNISGLDDTSSPIFDIVVEVHRL